MNRRQLLGAVAGGTAALAGCIDTAADEYPWPSVEESAREGWERIDERRSVYERSWLGIDAVTVHERTHVYGYRELRERIDDRTGETFDRDLARFVATRLTLEGISRRAATTDRIAGPVMDRIEAEFRDQGIESLETVEPDEPLPDIDGERFEYRGRTEIPRLTRELEAYGRTRTVDFEGGTIDVEGLFAIRKPDVETAYVAGGAYPAENYARERTLSPDGDDSDLEVTAGIDLELDPATLRERMVALIEGVGT